MVKSITMTWPLLLCVLMFATAAGAQTPARMQTRTPAPGDHGYAMINFGGQPQTHTFNDTLTPQIYGETASITVPHSIGSGALFDLAGGVRVAGNYAGYFAIGLGYSHFSKKETPTLSAQIPNPLVTDSPRSATASTGELSHSESAVHLQFAWVGTITDAFSLAGIVGPSFIKVNQDLVTGVTPVEGAPPFSTVTIGSVATSSQSAWAKGVNIGVDGAFVFTRGVGVGAFIRYAGGTADLPNGTGGTASVKAGGFQTGAGLRFRF